MNAMIDEKQKAVAPRSNGFDDKPLNSQCVRSILKRLSSVLKKHAEILAFYEAKNPRCFAHRGPLQNLPNRN